MLNGVVWCVCGWVVCVCVCVCARVCARAGGSVVWVGVVCGACVGGACVVGVWVGGVCQWAGTDLCCVETT
jgi:hypothetical protein